MSNLKHVVHRRVHLERSQPKSRQKLGLLEKKRDYTRRSQYYHKRQDLLRSLHEKARNRNEDEFNREMLHSEKTEKGILNVSSKIKLRKVKNQEKLKALKKTQQCLQMKYMSLRKKEEKHFQSDIITNSLRKSLQATSLSSHALNSSSKTQFSQPSAMEASQLISDYKKKKAVSAASTPFVIRPKKVKSSQQHQKLKQKSKQISQALSSLQTQQDRGQVGHFSDVSKSSGSKAFQGYTQRKR